MGSLKRIIGKNFCEYENRTTGKKKGIIYQGLVMMNIN